MIFSSIQYLIFLPIVVFLYWRTRGSVRLALVVGASYFFYMSWFPIYGALLLFLTAANWALARGLGATTLQFQKKAYLIAGLLLNLGCLCYYKYINFILINLFALLNFGHNVAGGDSLATKTWHYSALNVILPLGISFFVFEFVHYIVDVYRGDKPVKSFTEFAAFASFFPSQIAGPIKRYQDFNDRLRLPEPWTLGLFYEGMTLIMQGLFKKVAIADPIGVLVNRPFATMVPLSSADAIIAAIGFTAQVYCDFSGYTDIGRGSALLLGIRLPENFDLPYLAHDLADFWRRWHMSLSYWLRDYVYIPLGGSRKNRFANWRNLFITMVACGLWHGASWHYVVFGAMQGMGLIVNREWKMLLKSARWLNTALDNWAGKALGTALTMCFICLTYAVFRAPDLPHAWNLLGSVLSFSGNCRLWSGLTNSCVIPFTSLYFGFWLLTELVKRRPQYFGALLQRGYGHALQYSSPLRFASWTAAVMIAVAARPTEAVPFVYFQF